MATIYDFLNNALPKKLSLQSNPDLPVFFISLVLATIPLPYAFNSIALVLFVAFALISQRRQRPVFTLSLVLPMLLYIVMAASLFWTIDAQSTSKALGKEISLLLLPLCFCLNAGIRHGRLKTILEYYTRAMVVFGAYFLGRAVLRYIHTGNSDVFFYHELVTEDVNAIYISTLFSVALFWLLVKKQKSAAEYGALVFVTILIFMLSSKTVILTDVLLVGVYFLFYSGVPRRAKLVSVLLFCVLIAGLGYYGKIKERLLAEYNAGPADSYTAAVAGTTYKVGLRDAWSKPEFESNAYLGGTAFRVYQVRIFTEMLEEEPILFTGYGLNATEQKIYEKGIEHKLDSQEGLQYAYHKQNFHNQYVQAFADLGLFGFVIVLLMVAVNLKNGIRRKDFVHIAFAGLMITLFLTESFLWRQRGIVFFTMFYCLFNSSMLTSYTEKQHI